MLSNVRLELRAAPRRAGRRSGGPRLAPLVLRPVAPRDAPPSAEPTLRRRTPRRPVLATVRGNPLGPIGPRLGRCPIRSARRRTRCRQADPKTRSRRYSPTTLPRGDVVAGRRHRLALPRSRRDSRATPRAAGVAADRQHRRAQRSCGPPRGLEHRTRLPRCDTPVRTEELTQSRGSHALVAVLWQRCFSQLRDVARAAEDAIRGGGKDLSPLSCHGLSGCSPCRSSGRQKPKGPK